MKLWIDDVRLAPEGYIWVKSVNEAKKIISDENNLITHIDLDHDAGDYASDGGDYIKVLDYIEELIRTSSTLFSLSLQKMNYHIHSMNAVGRENMMRIIHKNGWEEV